MMTAPPMMRMFVVVLITSVVVVIVPSRASTLFPVVVSLTLGEQRPLMFP